MSRQRPDKEASRNVSLIAPSRHSTGQSLLVIKNEGHGPGSKDRQYRVLSGYAANSLRTAAAEFPTLSMAFCSCLNLLRSDGHL